MQHQGQDPIHSGRLTQRVSEDDEKVQLSGILWHLQRVGSTGFPWEPFPRNTFKDHKKKN